MSFFGSSPRSGPHFEANALAVQGSGRSVLAWDTFGQPQFVVRLYDHQGNVPMCMVPPLMLDIREHAHYLDYHNDKATFVKQP